MIGSRVLRLALVACAAALAVSGCAAGFDPYTSPSLEPRDGANYPEHGSSAPLLVRHAFVLGPTPDEEPFAEGGNAAVYLNLINQRSRADRLMSASSPDAREVVLAAGVTDGEQAVTDDSPSGIEIPPAAPGRDDADAVRVGQPPYAEEAITLTGLTRQVRVASQVRVTFQFQRAGEITMRLPVVPRAAHRATLSPAPSETAAEKPTGGGDAEDEG